MEIRVEGTVQKEIFLGIQEIKQINFVLWKFGCEEE